MNPQDRVRVEEKLRSRDGGRSLAGKEGAASFR
jgi:hypothetical protein